MQQRDATAEELRERGLAAQARGDLQGAATLLEQCLTALRAQGAPPLLGQVLGELAWLALARGQAQEAQRRYREALALATEAGDTAREAAVLRTLGDVARQQGDEPRSMQHYQQALALYRRLQDNHGEAAMLGELGTLAARRGASEHAATLFERALELQRAAGDWPGLAQTYGRLADLARARGDHRAAAELLQQALPLYQDLQDDRGAAAVLVDLGSSAAEVGNTGLAAQAYEMATGLFQRLNDHTNQGRALFNLSAIVAAMGDAPGAMALLRESSFHLEQGGDRESLQQAQAHLDALDAATAPVSPLREVRRPDAQDEGPLPGGPSFATIYAPVEKVIEARELQELAGAGAQVGIKKGLFGGVSYLRLAFGPYTVTLDVLSSKELAKHLRGLEAFARPLAQRQDGPPEALFRQMAAIRQVLEVTIEPGLDREGRCKDLVRAIARHYGGFFFAQDAIYDAEGALQLGSFGARDY